MSHLSKKRGLPKAKTAMISTEEKYYLTAKTNTKKTKRLRVVSKTYFDIPCNTACVCCDNERGEEDLDDDGATVYMDRCFSKPRIQKAISTRIYIAKHYRNRQNSELPQKRHII